MIPDAILQLFVGLTYPQTFVTLVFPLILLL